MRTLPEQFSAAGKSQVLAQLDFFTSVNARAFAIAAKLVALNIDTGRATIDRSSATFKQLAAMRGPHDLLAFSNLAGENFDQMVTYGSKWFGIVADAQADLLKQGGSRTAAAVPAPVAVAAAKPAHVEPAKPASEPVAAVAPEPVPEPAPEPAAKPIAKAAGKAAGKRSAAKPVAAVAPSPSAAAPVPHLKPVDATAPFQSNPPTSKRGKKR